MARYPQGATVRLSVTVRDATGALVNASASLITVRHAAVSTTYTTPVNDGVGLYHLDLPAPDVAVVDHYGWVWDSTVSGSHAITVGSFDVFDPAEPSVLSLQDGKIQLNIAATDTSFDDEITAMIASITTLMEAATGGPIITRSVSERVRAGQDLRTLTLRSRPVVAVTSITDTANGQALPVTDLDVDTTTGIVRRKLQLPFAGYGLGYLVVYTAGWGTSVASAFNQAARVALEDMWSTQRGASLAPAFGGGVGGVPGFQIVPTPGVLPDRALEFLRPYTVEAYV
jgi:hypothetical protein